MIIGIIGKKRVGKDTISDYLVNNYNFTKYGFGDPVKQISQIMFDFSDDQINTDLKEEIDNRWNVTPREIFQTIGTEFAREYIHLKLPNLKVNKGNFWIAKFNIWYNDMLKKNKDFKVVISDVRFNNEYDFLKQLGCIFIKVTRNNNFNDEHKSENELNFLQETDINYLINNNENILELYKKVDFIIKNI